MSSTAAEEQRVIMSAKTGPRGAERGQHQQRCHSCHKFIAIDSESKRVAGEGDLQ